MQEAFSEAYLHTAHRILGVRLRPFSACHYLHLESVESPLVKEAEHISAADLLHALKVCSIKPELIEGAYQIPSHKIRFTLADKWRIGRMSTAKDQAHVLKAWQAYQGDFCSLPERMENMEHKPAPLSAPGVIAAVVAALDFLPESRAWTMPIGTLFTYEEVRAELQGAKIRFRPSKGEEEKILEQLKEAEKEGARLLAERMAKNGNA